MKRLEAETEKKKELEIFGVVIATGSVVLFSEGHSICAAETRF